MESTPRLYETLVHVLSQQANWVDRRHLKTLAWMMVGLIQASVVSLTAWAPYVHSRAVYAQSLVRRFDRWLQNQRIEVHQLYGPLIQHALAEWGTHALYLALDTSTLWDTYCLVRIALIYRGRAIPLVWKVLQHPSSSVTYTAYADLLDTAASLLPLQCKVIFVADRGFADTRLMEHLRRLDWHWRIRFKSSFWIYRRGHQPCKASRLSLALGEARFWHHVYITKGCYGPVHLALARRQDGKEDWFIVSDEPTDLQTFEEYGLRFDIEENFLDDKSNGFQLESSLIRSATALERLCLVLAITTLYLVSQGTEVVKQGQRRWVDPHWFRGQSYLKIGWKWVERALSRGYKLVTRLYLSAEADPEPAMASRRQAQKPPCRVIALEFHNAVA
jgi:Transposase DDE domain